MAAMLEQVSNFVRAHAPRPRALRTVLAAALLTVATYAAATQLRTDHPDTYVVKRGDTLWGIASELATDGDVRATMHEIEQLNALDSVALSAGQKLRVPVSTD